MSRKCGSTLRNADRELDPTRPPRLDGLGPGLAAVEFGDRPHQVETESHPAFTAREGAVSLYEAIEEPVEVLGVQLVARVLDTQVDHPADRGAAHGHRRAGWAELDRVVQQVQRDLLDAVDVERRVGQFGVQSELHH